MLHVGPEPALDAALRGVGGLHRITADLLDRRAMVQIDLTDIPLPTGYFDVIYCSHVLEHIPDDRRAMQELYRVLRPGGWAILQVPVLRELTFEDPSITSPEERLRFFGQRDHVRVYGMDFPERLTGVGFLVTVEDFAATFRARTRRYFGLLDGEVLYLCRKVPTANLSRP
jgi:SAM-dependent methyltransferase